MAASILGQFFLIAAAAVTVATFTVAKQSKLFVHGAGRRSDCKHALFLIFTGHKLKLKTVCAGPLEKSVGQGIQIISDVELFEILAKVSITTQKQDNTKCGY